MDSYLAKGKRGETFIREQDGKRVLVKRKNPASDVDTIQHEAIFTQKLNKAGIGPAFISYDKETNELVREYIDGIELRKWIETAGKEELLTILRDLLKQCRTMDLLGINKQELNHPWKDILIADKPYIIDFERCRNTQSPKNVTQFCQFLAGSNMQHYFSEKKINIDTQQFHTLAQAYKESLPEAIFNKMLEVLHAD